eukprot:gene10808-3426_t
MGNSPTSQQIEKINMPQVAVSLKKIWKRKLLQLPVGKDLPRLCRNFVIYDEYGLPVTTKLNESFSDIQQTQVILHSIFVSLANVNELSSLKNLTYESFAEEVNPSDHESLNQFILKNFGEEAKTTLLLKSCNQSCMAPPITQLKKVLLRKIQYKDVQGGWKVEIHCKKNQFLVIHSRIEQVIEKVSPGYKMSYRFRWKFVMVFDVINDSIELNEIYYKFIDCDFDKSEVQMNSKEKKETIDFFEKLLNDLTINYSSDVYKKEQKAEDEKNLNK